MNNYCAYSRHLCHRERVSGFDFCAVHILEDKNAPYKQCSFPHKGSVPASAATPGGPSSAPGLAPSGRRCHRPAAKSLASTSKNPQYDKQREAFCLEHTRRVLIARQISGFAPPVTPVSSSLSLTPAAAASTVTPGSRKRRAGSAASATATTPSSSSTHASALKYVKDLSHYEGLELDAAKKEPVAVSAPDQPPKPKKKYSDASFGTYLMFRHFGPTNSSGYNLYILHP